MSELQGTMFQDRRTKIFVTIVALVAQATLVRNYYIHSIMYYKSMYLYLYVLHL